MTGPSNNRRRRPDGRAPLRAEWDPIKSSAERSRRPRERSTYGKQGAFARLVSAYGWRTYAVPVLAVLTVVALILTFWNNPFRPEQSPDAVAAPELLPRDSTPSRTIIGAPTITAVPGPVPPAGQLPEGGEFTAQGTGLWHVVPGSTGRVGSPQGEEYTYMIAVEDGIDMGGLGGDDSFAQMVDRSLADPRSWISDPVNAFRRITEGRPDFTVSLTSPMTTRSACGYTIQLETSCYNGELGRVVINLARWVRGATAFEGDLTAYRQYAINHEIGHAIGYHIHAQCPGNNALAPIMMQQSFGVANRDIFAVDPTPGFDDDRVCRPNAWVAPIVR